MTPPLTLDREGKSIVDARRCYALADVTPPPPKFGSCLVPSCGEGRTAPKEEAIFCHPSPLLSPQRSSDRSRTERRFPSPSGVSCGHRGRALSGGNGVSREDDDGRNATSFHLLVSPAASPSTTNGNGHSLALGCRSWSTETDSPSPLGAAAAAVSAWWFRRRWLTANPFHVSSVSPSSSSTVAIEQADAHRPGVSFVTFEEANAAAITKGNFDGVLCSVQH
nr:hypothetical protein Iba_chr11dCG10420 [Ipomoea batatas]